MRGVSRRQSRASRESVGPPVKAKGPPVKAKALLRSCHFYPSPRARPRVDLSTAMATRRGRGPAVNMTDAERERVKKVRKKEADGGLSTRLLYAVQNSEGDWVVYAKEKALEMIHGQTLNNTLPTVRPFDKTGYVLEDTDPEAAPETDENEAQGDRMASPATPGEGGVVVGSRVRPVNEDLCKKVHELRQQNRGIGIKTMARTLGVESKAVRDACEDLGMHASPRASPSLATPSGGDSTPRRSSGHLRASSAPLRPSAHYAPSLLHPLLRRAFRTPYVRLYTAAQLAPPPARASAQWLYHPFTRPRASLAPAGVARWV